MMQDYVIKHELPAGRLGQALDTSWRSDAGLSTHTCCQRRWPQQQRQPSVLIGAGLAVAHVISFPFLLSPVGGWPAPLVLVLPVERL